ALRVPTQRLGAALAGEWDPQRDVIDPAKMPLTRLANTIIDGVAASAPAIVAEIEKYLGSDLICYRADRPDTLVARQAQHWDPILAFARERLGAPFAVWQRARL